MDLEEEEDNLAKANPLSAEAIVRLVCDNHHSPIRSELEGDKDEEEKDPLKLLKALRAVMTLEKYMKQIGVDCSSISMDRLHLRTKKTLAGQ